MTVHQFDALATYIQTGKFSDLIAAAQKEPERVSLYLNVLVQEISKHTWDYRQWWIMGVVQGILWPNLTPGWSDDDQLSELIKVAGSEYIIAVPNNEVPPRDIVGDKQWIKRAEKQDTRNHDNDRQDS